MPRTPDTAELVASDLNRDVEKTLAERTASLVKRWNREYWEYRLMFAAVIFILTLFVVCSGVSTLGKEHLDLSQGLEGLWMNRDVQILVILWTIFRCSVIGDYNRSEDHELLASSTFAHLKGKLPGMVRNPWSLTFQSIGCLLLCLALSANLISFAIAQKWVSLENMRDLAIYMMVLGFVMAAVAIVRTAVVSGKIKYEMQLLQPLSEKGLCQEFECMVKNRSELSLLPPVPRVIRFADYEHALTLMACETKDSIVQDERDACTRLHSQIGVAS